MVGEEEALGTERSVIEYVVKPGVKRRKKQFVL